MERAVLLSDGGAIEPEHLPLESAAAGGCRRARAAPVAAPAAPPPPGLTADKHADAEQIIAVMAAVGRQSDARGEEAGRGARHVDRAAEALWHQAPADRRLNQRVALAVALLADAERWRDAGDPRRATACALRAVALFERHEGRAHPDVAAALLALGGARELGDGWREALGHYRRADTIMPKLRSFARSRCAAVARQGGARAVRRSTRARAVRGGRAAWTARRPAGRTVFRRARSRAGRGAQRPGYAAQVPGALRGGAAPLPTRARDPARRRAGRQPRRSRDLHNLGGIEHARARYADGEPLARRAVALRTRALGPRHPAVAADVAALAAIVEARGRLTEAARLYRRALAVFRRVYGARSYEVGVNLAGLAGVFQARGRAAQAERVTGRRWRFTGGCSATDTSRSR